MSIRINNMHTEKRETLINDVIPKPVRAEEPAFPRRAVKTKLLSLLPVITIALLIATTSLAQTAPSVTSAPRPDTTKPIPYLTPLSQDTGLPGLKQQLRKLQTTGRLMMVVAHPDDEDGGTLTLEARGKGVQTLLLTLTRGEGGQNELGTGLFDKLGILRTLELLAADKYYGVEQRFSRVADFGYSKTPEETFQKWGGHDVPLADIVRVIRTFRPDVLVARFSGTDNDGHGHHQASAILTREAFRAAADPNRFPEQIKEGLQPWQAKKLYSGNVCGFFSNTCADENWTVKLDRGVVDPVLGMSYAQMAADGLAHQRSQGHGEYKVPPGPRVSFYKLVDSVLPNTKDAIGHEKDFFDGIDTSLPGLAALLGEDKEKAPWLVTELKKIVGHIDDSADALSSVVGEFNSLSDRLDHSDLQPGTKAAISDMLSAKEDEAEAAFNLALNVTLNVNVTAPQGPEAAPPPVGDALINVSPRQRFEVIAKLHNGSKYWLNIENAGFDPLHGWLRRVHAEQATISPREDYYANFFIQIPADAPYSKPYWHRDDPETDSVNQIADEMYQTLPFAANAPLVTVTYDFAAGRGVHSLLPDAINGNSITRHSAKRGGGKIATTLEVPFTDAIGATEKIALSVTPPFSVALEPGEQVLPVTDGKETTVKVGVSSNLTGAPAGTLHLDLPAGWRAEPDSLKVSLPKRGDQQDFTFKVFPANLKEGRSEIHAVLDAGGTKYAEGYTLVTREDIGSAYYFQPAVQHLSIVDVKVPAALKLGYILGAGDDIPTVLQQIGMNVTIIPAERITTENLSQYGAIVLGVRAYDAQKDVVANSQKLLDYVSNGGTLVVQHNNDTGAFNSAHFTPYPATLSRTRVSVEEAPVTILAPDNPVFHYPNEISQKDFAGWVQERGLYFMDKWDDHFTPLLSCRDPNEPDQKGGLLYAKYGKGIYIYSGYAFYRQVPAGVSGAIRLFVNLVSAGSAGAASSD
jgi:LmbE family N-acetylglucosaminyl deacetylase